MIAVKDFTDSYQAKQPISLVFICNQVQKKID